MEWAEFFIEAFEGSWDMLKTLAVIIFPLLIGIELTEELEILTRLSKLFAPVLKHFQLPKEASLSLIVAQIFGLTYGAGVILTEVKEDKLNQRELMTLTVFLVICHAVIEDTLLFIAIGGRGFVMLGTRLVLAVVITYVYTHYLAGNSQEEEIRNQKSVRA